MTRLSELFARLNAWLRPAETAPLTLSWRTQSAGHPLTTEPCSAYYHIALSPKGMFEIFETEGCFLLHFPRPMALPAELFSSLTEAKERALTVLIYQEPDHDHQ